MNSNKRDIYFDGRIYQDVPDGMSRYNYGAVPIQGDHPFTNMEDVTGRYELKKCNCKIGVDCPFTKSKWFSTCTIAIPLPTPAPVEEQDIYDSVYMEVVKAVEEDNISGDMYSNTIEKLKKLFIITKR